MKPPGWMVIEPHSQWQMAPDGKAVTFNVRIRRWHPAFWWIVFQMLVLKRDPLERKDVER